MQWMDKALTSGTAGTFFADEFRCPIPRPRPHPHSERLMDMAREGIVPGVWFCTLLYCTVQYCAELFCTIHYCTVLYCTELYCTVLCSTIIFVSLPLSPPSGPLKLILNAGGPERLSRADMADILAQVRGYGTATSADITGGSHALSAGQLAGTKGEGAKDLPALSTLIQRVPAASAVSAVFSCSILQWTVLCALYCTVLYCTVLYSTVLYCTVLYCTVLA